MAQSYTRQSTFADGDTITASLFNNEYNQILNAFAYSSTNATITGHRHDGSAAQGGNIPQIGDLDFNNKIVVDSTNNRWGVYVEVSGSAVEQIRIQDGAIVPVTDNDIDLGTSALEFKDLFINGTAHVDTLDVDVNATVAGTLGVTGATTLSSTLQATTITATTAFVPDASDGASLGTVSLEFSDLFLADGALIAFGNDQDVTITHLADSGLLLNGARGLFFNDTTQYINAPNGTTLDIAATDEIELNATLIDINGAVDISGNLDIGGNLVVTGTTTFNGGTLTMGDAATDNVVFGADINSNIIPNTDDTYDLGSSLQEWRNLYIDGTANIDSLVADTADINGGTIDGVTIGGASAGDITYANLSDGTITITAFVDEDNMSSDSATLVPTQQSVKAYVDAQVTAQDFDFQGDTGGALSIDLDSETMTFTGGTGIDTSGSGNAVTFAIDSTVTTLTGSQTLTNKILTSPDINTPDIDGGTIDGAVIGGSSAAAITGTVITGSSLDISGDADIDGTLEADAITVNGTALGEVIADTVGAMVSSNTETNITVTYEDSDNTLDFVIGTLNQDTTGNAATATALETARTIGGVSFDGTANITPTTFTTATFSGDVNVDSGLLFADVSTNRIGVNQASPDVSLDLGANTDAVHVPVGTTAQRPGSAAAGYFRYNTSLAQFEGYTDSWGAIGGGGTNTFTHDVFTCNGSTTDFTLSQATESENNLIVFIDGVFQEQGAYSIATAAGVTTLTMSVAPANGRKLVVYTVAAGVSGSNLNIDTMTGDGSDTTLTLSINPVNENNTQVFIDGVYQSKANYSISGTTLTFSTAPPTGSAVEVMTMTQTEVNVPVDGTITSAKLSGDLTLPGDLSFADNSKAIFGAGSDLQIYHDGTNSYISDQGTNDLKVLATDFQLKNAADDEFMMTAVTDGAVTAYHNGSAKLATTATGINVTGTATMDGLTVEGASAGGTYITSSSGPAGGDIKIEHIINSSRSLNTINSESGINSAIPLALATGGVERMRLDTSGNVGIGTTPVYDFDILDTSETILGIRASDSSGTNVAIRFQDAGTGTGVNGLYVGRASALNYFWTYEAEPLLFGTSATERLRIDSSGNVGIGTATTTAIRLTATTATANHVGLQVENSNTADSFGMIVKAGNDANDYTADFRKRDNTTIMRIRGDGSVGIGTTSPASVLDVRGARSDLLRLYSTAAGGNAEIELLTLNNASSVGKLSKITATQVGADTNGSILAFSTSPTTSNTPVEHLRIDASGNVGIATSSPPEGFAIGATSSVAGFSIGSGETQAFLRYNNYYSGTAQVSDATKGAASISLGRGSDGVITFNTAAAGAGVPTEAARIDASGNLLVGTTNSSVSVDVGIKLRAGSADKGVALVSANSTSASEGFTMWSTGANAWRFYVGWDGKINATSNTIQAISDQRFKENIRDLDDGLSKVMQLKPRKFDWKEGKGADIKNARGFIAQEFEEVFPDLIGEWKDPAPEGEEPYKAVSQDLIPTLVKAIQEQQATIEALTARIAALES